MALLAFDLLADASVVLPAVSIPTAIHTSNAYAMDNEAYASGTASGRPWAGTTTDPGFGALHYPQPSRRARVSSSETGSKDS